MDPAVISGAAPEWVDELLVLLLVFELVLDVFDVTVEEPRTVVEPRVLVMVVLLLEIVVKRAEVVTAEDVTDVVRLLAAKDEDTDTEDTNEDNTDEVTDAAAAAAVISDAASTDAIEDMEPAFVGVAVADTWLAIDSTIEMAVVFEEEAPLRISLLESVRIPRRGHKFCLTHAVVSRVRLSIVDVYASVL